MRLLGRDRVARTALVPASRAQRAEVAALVGPRAGAEQADGDARPWVYDALVFGRGARAQDARGACRGILLAVDGRASEGPVTPASEWHGYAARMEEAGFLPMFGGWPSLVCQP